MKFEIYGDSIRAGYKISSKVYTEKIPNFEIENFSENGASVFDVLEKVFEIEKFEDSYALVGVGVNDIIWNREPKIVFQRTLEIVKRLNALGRIVFVESILPVKKTYFLSMLDFTEEELNEKIQKLNSLLEIESKNGEFIFVKYDFSKIKFSTNDGIHPDDFGNTQLETKLLSFLENFIL